MIAAVAISSAGGALRVTDAGCLSLLWSVLSMIIQHSSPLQGGN